MEENVRLEKKNVLDFLTTKTLKRLPRALRKGGGGLPFLPDREGGERWSRYLSPMAPGSHLGRFNSHWGFGRRWSGVSPGPGAGLRLAGDSDVWPAGDQNQCLGKAGGLRAARGAWSLDSGQHRPRTSVCYKWLCSRHSHLQSSREDSIKM